MVESRFAKFIDLSIPETRIRLITIGYETDSILANALKTLTRKETKFKTVVDIQSNPSLALWEDILDGQFPAAVLVRPTFQLPTTPIGTPQKILMPVSISELGEWFSIKAPTYGWVFPPKWKFPAWITSLLPKLSKTHKAHSFEDLSIAGLDSLLAEYAGIIDRGNSFALTTGTPICENIHAYLRNRYGSQEGLDKQVDFWLDALEMQTENSLSIFGRISKDSHKEKIPWIPTPYVEFHQSIRRRPVVNLQTAEEFVRDTVFMGSCDMPELANRDVLFGTFMHNGKRLRRFHEGKHRFSPARMRVDEDPSDMTTCGIIRSRGDLMRVAGEPPREGQRSILSEANQWTAPPEGIAFYEAEDWTPSIEYLPGLTKQLFEHEIPYSLDEQPAGYTKLGDPGLKTADRFYPLKLWIRHWDSDMKAMVPGFSESLTAQERKLWIYSPSGLWLEFVSDIPYAPTLLFFRKSNMPDVPLNPKSQRAKNLTQKFKSNDPNLPQRAAAKIARWKKTPEGMSWSLPYSFTNKKGADVHLGPKPFNFDKTDWAIWKRSWTSLATVRKLLAEERWKQLAFDPKFPVEEMFISEQNSFDSEEELETVAAYKIENFLLEIKSRVANTCLDTDIKQDFEREVASVMELIAPAINGDKPIEPVNLVNMNPKYKEPQPRKAQAENPVHAQIIESWRCIYAAANIMKKKPGALGAYGIYLQKKVLWSIGGKIGPAPKIKDITPVVVDEDLEDQLTLKDKKDHAMKVAWASLLTTSTDYPNERRQKAKEWLISHDRKQARNIHQRYKGPGRKLAGPVLA